MKVDILGTEYTLTVCDEHERLGEYCGALCDETTKEMLVKSYAGERSDPNAKKNLDVQVKKNKRHEIIHAFLFESGLAENSPWAQNEEMVDFFAIQFPKIAKAIQQAEAM